MVLVDRPNRDPAANGAATPLADSIEALVRDAVRSQSVWDMHTHLYPVSFGTPFGGSGGRDDPSGLLLWGIDELLTYHYLVAEVFRVVPSTVLSYDDFWRMTKRQQADHIWKWLFIERSPVSESCRGVLTTLVSLGLDVGERDLDRYRKWFAQQDPNDHIDRVMQIAGVKRITMTNAVFDDNERPVQQGCHTISTGDCRSISLVKFGIVSADCHERRTAYQPRMD